MVWRNKMDKENLTIKLGALFSVTDIQDKLLIKTPFENKNTGDNFVVFASSYKDKILLSDGGETLDGFQVSSKEFDEYIETICNTFGVFVNENDEIITFANGEDDVVKVLGNLLQAMINLAYVK